ncbi:Uncharacterised protein [Mycobacterium tuberculosis]|nr:Uncharacterised protein [Mycobacterium tuberculosis]
MRAFSLTALFIILIYSFAGVRVLAEEITATAAPSNVPANPDETDQTNIMGRLDKLNKYTSLQEIEPGTYKVSFINIVGENANEYEINRPEKITIKEGKTTNFDIQISLKANFEESEALSDEAQEEMVADLMGANDKIGEIVEDQGKSNVAPLNVDQPPVDAVSSTSSTKTIDDSTINIIIGVSVLLGLGLLFFLYKQLIYKHDYYDC